MTEEQKQKIENIKSKVNELLDNDDFKGIAYLFSYGFETDDATGIVASGSMGGSIEQISHLLLQQNEKVCKAIDEIAGYYSELN